MNKEEAERKLDAEPIIEAARECAIIRNWLATLESCLK
jgi:hypothetical protein